MDEGPALHNPVRPATCPAILRGMTSLVKVAHGLRRPQEQVSDLVGRVCALLAVCPDGTVVSGVTAAQLHGLWLPPELDGPVETIIHRHIEVPARRPRSRRPELRSRRQLLSDDEIVLVDGIPATSEARTWLDLALRLPMADLVALGDSALRGAARIEELAELVARAVHRPGVINARTALPLLDARSRSRPESHLRFILHAAGLPAPAVNCSIYSATGEWLAEPDLSYDDVRLAIEYNGADHAGLERMRRDITRELDVAERGAWRTVTFGPAQVFRRPDQVSNRVRALRHELAARRPDGWSVAQWGDQWREMSHH